MKNIRILICTVYLILGTTLIYGCTHLQQSETPTEDTRYLTPIPQSTLDAFSITQLSITQPITTKLQAVILARRELGATRLLFTGEPIVVSAEEMSLDEAIQQIGQTGVDSYIGEPGNSKVWLVIFEGDIQIIFDPLHTVTPQPPSHKCAYVIIYANSAQGAQVTSKQCPNSR